MKYRRNLLLTGVLGALAAMPCSAGDGDCISAFLQPKILAGLAHAATVQELEQRYRSLPFSDTALDVTEAARRFELVPDDAAADRIIAVAPRNPLEFSYYYSVTRTVVDGKGDQASSDIVYSYVEYLAKSIVRRKRGYRALIILNRFADGEMLDVIQDWTGFVLKKDQEAFLKAFRTADSETQARFCGDRRDSLCRAVKAAE